MTDIQPIVLSETPPWQRRGAILAIVLVLLWLPISGFASVRCGANELPADVVAALKNGKSFELYSIEPSGQKGAKETSQGYPVIGKTAVADAAARASLIDALQKGIAASNGEIAACFNPRHAIRVVHDGKTYDLVICFECLQIEIFIDNKRGKGVLISSEPKAAFDKVLTDAKVKLE